MPECVPKEYSKKEIMMNPKIKKKRIRNRLLLLVLILLPVPFFACGGGGGGETSGNNVVEEPEEEVVVEDQPTTGTYFRVKDEKANAWATLTDIGQYDLLNTGNFQDPKLFKWLVTTDSEGEALICPKNAVNTSTQTCSDVACRIYVYGSSDFGPHCCPESESGSTSCSCSGTQAFDDCDFTTRTLTADISSSGTWYSVTYLWDAQITIVIVGEGQVEVTPVDILTFEGELPRLNLLEPLERGAAWDQFNVNERIMGEPQLVNVDQLGAAQFYYTAPLDQLDFINLDQGGIPARQWHSIVDLPLLVDQLKPLDFHLEPWINNIWEKSQESDINLGPIPEIQNEYLVLSGIGSTWEDPVLREALLIGVDWNRIVEEFFDDNIQVSVMNEDDLGNISLVNSRARSVGFNIELAQEQMAEAGYANEYEIAIVIPADQEYLVESADWISGYLQESGFITQIMVLDRTIWSEQMKEMAAAGIPSIIYYYDNQ